MVKNPLTCRARRETVERLRDAVITLSDDDYPPLLKQIPDPPLVLHFRGRKELLAKPAIAIVGSRTASPYGINAAQELTRQIVGTGLAIISGMARGIDCAAHTTTLDSGGSTIGVLGTGIDIAYPRDNKPLYRRMCTEGLLLTEFRPGMPPLKMNFPIRNRIISGLTLGTVIVEATGRSGSLVTARMALEQNREVFAVPGSIFSPGSEGPHRLCSTARSWCTTPATYCRNCRPASACNCRRRRPLRRYPTSRSAACSKRSAATKAATSTIWPSTSAARRRLWPSCCSSWSWPAGSARCPAQGGYA